MIVAAARSTRRIPRSSGAGQRRLADIRVGADLVESDGPVVNESRVVFRHPLVRSAVTGVPGQRPRVHPRGSQAATDAHSIRIAAPGNGRQAAPKHDAGGCRGNRGIAATSARAWRFRSGRGVPG